MLVTVYFRNEAVAGDVEGATENSPADGEDLSGPAQGHEERAQRLQTAASHQDTPAR